MTIGTSRGINKMGIILNMVPIFCFSKISYPDYLTLLVLLTGVRGTMMIASNKATSNTVTMILFF